MGSIDRVLPTRYQALLILWKQNPRSMDKEDLIELVGLQNAEVARLQTEKGPSAAPMPVPSAPPPTEAPIPLPDSPRRLEALRQAREAVYGETGLNMRTIGLAWTGHVEATYGFRLPFPLPPFSVANMLVSMKTVRACGPSYHHDNYDDAHNFLTFAEEYDWRNPNGKAHPDDRMLYGRGKDDQGKPGPMGPRGCGSWQERTDG